MRNLLYSLSFAALLTVLNTLAYGQLSCTAFLETASTSPRVYDLQCTDSNPPLVASFDSGEVFLYGQYQSYSVLDSHSASYIFNSLSLGLIQVGGAQAEAVSMNDFGSGDFTAWGTTPFLFDTIHLMGTYQSFDPGLCPGICSFEIRVEVH